MANSILTTLEKKDSLFLEKIPSIPQGAYVHFVTVRETESFPLFQTDGTLNTITVRAGVKTEANISRLVIFKRKQTTPERLTGRELLRYYDLISSEGKNACVYNAPKGGACKTCPDCILYGYAIGEGAEKSKVHIDTAYSVSPYDESHKPFSFNAPYESGTMTDDQGKTKTSFGEQDHVVPQVFFPSVVTLRDPTYDGFLYVLGNLLRTDRYGAQDSRTGKLYNHLVAIVFTNGEIFSNLRFSQVIYDLLCERNQWTEPLERWAVLLAAQDAYRFLMDDEPVVQRLSVFGDELQNLRSEVVDLYQDEQRTRDLLARLDQATKEYSAKARKGGEKEKKE